MSWSLLIVSPAQGILGRSELEIILSSVLGEGPFDVATRISRNGVYEDEYLWRFPDAEVAAIAHGLLDDGVLRKMGDLTALLYEEVDDDGPGEPAVGGPWPTATGYAAQCLAASVGSPLPPGLSGCGWYYGITDQDDVAVFLEAWAMDADDPPRCPACGAVASVVRGSTAESALGLPARDQ